jgi:hypothetical protein
MRFLPPFVVFGTLGLTPEDIAQRSRSYRSLIEALVAGEPDAAERERLAGAITINGFVSRLVGSEA